MKNEDKELLLKDLCARLPYSIEVEYNNCTCELLSIDKDNEELTIWKSFGYKSDVKLEDVKPYLFPLSSMTEEQRKEYTSLLDHIMTIEGDVCDVCTVKSINWLYENHFDVNGLIPLGLAKDATGLKIYY